ncbi:serine hydrolase domain-containing protein [Mycobacterium hubeiense]|uniref:esterase/beta-lactamase LipL n=1 Tax=Mycobacterium hubeiense TaxID=1867256 RepID=UPI000C7F3DBB|nr:serine hydrolase domain-containing protein [Mycobacterium sp. QGD 101]
MDQQISRNTSGLPSRVEGTADPSFTWAVRAFASLFPRRPGFGGGALAVYLDGVPVVDVWTGWADRSRTVPWSADTGAVVMSATKGMAATVIHRLADRGLIDYGAPVAHHWPAFGANGKATITVRDVMGHRAGLSRLNGITKADFLDHRAMEERVAAAAPDRVLGKSAYHAFTYGWLLAGLARAVTGKSMRELFRLELAAPLGTDGLHLGRPPAGAPTRAAQIITLKRTVANPRFNSLAPKVAAWPRSGLFGAMYFPEVRSIVQGEIPLLDTELPGANGVATARGLARMYGAIANGGMIDGRQFLSAGVVANLTGRRSLRIDGNLLLPVAFHLGYHAVPVPGVMPGFGHVGMGGSVGWADPASGLAFAFVHNRLHPLTVSDQVMFVPLNALIRRGAALARNRGFAAVPDFGAPITEPPTTAAS